MPLEPSAPSGESGVTQALSSIWLPPSSPVLREDAAEGADEDQVEDEGANEEEEEDAPRSGGSRGGLRPEPPAEESPASSTYPNQGIADTALEYLGAPYAWAGNSPRGFDCSGFVQYVYKLNDISLPRDIAGMIRLGETVARDSLEAGDVVVFINTFERGLSHVGIYLSEGRFIHSVTQGRGVGIDSIEGGFWGNHYYSAIRFQ